MWTISCVQVQVNAQLEKEITNSEHREALKALLLSSRGQ